MMKRPKRYPKIKAGAWVQPKRKYYRMACCDCGLVHKMEFKLIPYGDGKHKIRFRVWRDNKETAKLRKKENIRVTHPKE